MWHGRRRIAQDADDELFEQADRSIVRSSLLSLPTVPVFAGVLWWSSASRSGLVLWSVLTLAASLVNIVLPRFHASRGDGLDRRLTGRIISMAVGGATWGSLTLLALPDTAALHWCAMAALLLFGVLAANTIFAAPLRRLFFAFQIPVVTLAVVGFVLTWSPFNGLLAAVLAYGFAVSIVLHHQGHVAFVRAVRLARRNDELVHRSVAEGVELARINADLTGANEALTRQAGRDHLTDLVNRSVFHDRLTDSLRRRRETGCDVAVLFFDIDRFKSINDSLGHGAGDELLRSVPALVGVVLGRDDVLARFGGDEFTVLMAGRSADHATTTAERVRAALQTTFAVDDRIVEVSASVGVAVATDEDDPESLLRHADAALYRAKRLGRNRVQLFDAGLRDQLEVARAAKAELALAFAARQINMWFQPEVDLQSGRIVGAEALVRWHHPRRGLLRAGAFVSTVEDVGLAGELGFTQAKGCDVFSRRLAGLLPDGFRLHLNVTADHLSNPLVLDEFLAFVDRAAIDTAMLVFEVTETAVITDVVAARSWLDRARSHGVRVFLDDFGTGYSSLSLFSQLPVDGLKIDRCFVSDLRENAAARAIVAATVHLAGSLGLDVIAEGVETTEQAATLLDLGVWRGQGWLYADAVPVEQFRSFLADGPPWSSASLARQPALGPVR